MPLDAYRSFNALFTRGVKPEYRPIPADTPEILSPCDGTVQDVGRVRSGRILTVKGIEYSLASLLPDMDIDPSRAASSRSSFCRRLIATASSARWTAGSKKSCTFRALGCSSIPRSSGRSIRSTLERADDLSLLSAESGPCVVVMVAGWGVGNITLPLAPRFRPRSKRPGPSQLGVCPTPSNAATGSRRSSSVPRSC